ncbi:SDR family oxidoreductase [Paucibacter sp. TC2R-5]|uniref:SDR family NAD(P)-dependent oxidoreductase n=1 Tax=Paucibacter sp. TC2R-5 TaxID=2893555 RepID=UPI0021E4DD05|nr:SDR family NAD(P)-dependent oxidoreductase [Paucibacter sp. TC2R-5]MCV2360821.1 SDR family oxidoreductase [Paucibacter sp. TC2R-5]
MSVTSYVGKVVLITGARRGVGRLLTEHFLAGEARVIGFNRHEDEDELPGYTSMAVDIADPASVAQGFARIRQEFGQIDIVINNAAQLVSQYAMIMPAAAAKTMLEVNILGTFLVSREAAKLMRKPKWGRIINIGSMASSLEPMGDSVYAASKAAISTLANVMAREFAAFNVTCNTLAITAIETDMLAQLPKDKIDAVVAGLPLPRYAQPDDIFNVVDFFASERSAYVTAQTVYLGGVN